jgi:predicted metal-dependent phosphoesterase TrpH
VETPVSLIDLHVHSTESDGSLTPEVLAERAAALGLHTIALADHDSVAGVGRCMAACGALGLTCVPALELSARNGDTHVHVLGYFLDVRDPALLATLEEFRGHRVRRVMSMARALQDAGYDLDTGPLERQAREASLGRLHLAKALVTAGHATDTKDAFNRLIGNGRPFHLENDRPTPSEAVALVRSAGGLPVIAHPALSRVEHFIEPLAGEGLAGIEVYHGEHTLEQRARLALLADRLGLLATGGTDYHGPDGPSGEMGSSEIPDGVLEALYEAAGAEAPGR